jgi:hypothetical protein
MNLLLLTRLTWLTRVFSGADPLYGLLYALTAEDGLYLATEDGIYIGVSS